MSGGDIRHFYRPSTCSSWPRRAKKRPYELPLEQPNIWFFSLLKLIPASEPMIDIRMAKRLKDSDVKPQLKVRSKLAITQWHFNKETRRGPLYYLIVKGISENPILVKILIVWK